MSTETEPWWSYKPGLPETVPVPAGSHGQPLATVHADMARIGPNELRRHLALDHDRPIRGKRTDDYAEYAHRAEHGETGTPSDAPGRSGGAQGDRIGVPRPLDGDSAGCEGS
jgi:hypothetical protein